MWGGNATALDILVKPHAIDSVKEKLKENSIKYEIVIEDLQKAIDEENPTEIELDDRRGKDLISSVSYNLYFYTRLYQQNHC